MSTPANRERDREDAVDWTALSLGAILKQARLQARLTQAELGLRVDKTADQIRAIESGIRNPSLETLVELVAVLVPSRDRQVTVLARLLAKLQEHRISKLTVDPTHADLLQAASAQMIRALAPARRRLPPLFPRSLEGFPEQFQPLVAVFPDRREVPPDSPADMFIRSGAVGDYQFLPLLTGLDKPLTICSDKLFVVRDQQWLAERFSDAHFLIVGSNAVNWLTRTVANSAIFRPQIDANARAWNDGYLQQKAALQDNMLLNVFWHMVETAQRTPDREVDANAVPTHKLAAQEIARMPEGAALARHLLDGRTELEIERQFQVAAFADPAQREQHRRTGAGNDLGVVSLAPHPFDTTGRYVSILCAGIAGPGTALGLKALLSEQKMFASRPFGGVIGVRLPAGQDAWPGRYETAYWQWQTMPYAPEDVLNNLREAVDASESRRRAVFRDWSEEELQATVRFVEQLMAPAP